MRKSYHKIKDNEINRLWMVLRSTLDDTSEFKNCDPWEYMSYEQHPSISGTKDSEYRLLAASRRVSRWNASTIIDLLSLPHLYFKYTLYSLRRNTASTLVLLLINLLFRIVPPNFPQRLYEKQRLCKKEYSRIFASRLRPYFDGVIFKRLHRMVFGKTWPPIYWPSINRQLDYKLSHDVVAKFVPIGPDLRKTNVLEHQAGSPCYDLYACRWIFQIENLLDSTGRIRISPAYAMARLRIRFKWCCWKKAGLIDGQGYLLGLLAHGGYHQIPVLAWLLRSEITALELNTLEKKNMVFSDFICTAIGRKGPETDELLLLFEKGFNIGLLISFSQERR